MRLTLSKLFSVSNDRVGVSEGRRFLVVAILISCSLYLAVTVHTPLVVLSTAMDDDGLFIKLGQLFAQGDWFGPYDHKTLAKGPGYPVFLALNSWLGLPVSLAHALFHCTAVSIFSWVVLRISKSPLLGIAVLLITLWHPAFPNTRVIRQAIYPGQVLLVLACFSYALFVADRRAARFLSGSAAGLILGWFWLSREEGVWLLPGLGFLLVFAVARARRSHSNARTLLVPTATAVVVFFATHIAFQFGNRMAYGSFVGVDFKEGNFVAALTSLQSVTDGEQIPYVPVSRATRERIYEVSPAFASLRSYIDPPAGSPGQSGCQFYPWTCGDIAGGWFVWVLRSAAASKGHYQTPASASAFFGGLAGEVRTACGEGRLECNRSLIPYMPHVTREQLEAVPKSISEAMAWLCLSRRPDYGSTWSSTGSEQALDQALAFLNHPIHRPASDVTHHFEFRGWYYEKDDAWPKFDVARRNGTLAGSRVVRRPNRGIADSTGNPRATRQRFRAETKCGEGCTLVVTSSDGATLRLSIDEFVDKPARLHRVGDGRLHLLVTKRPGYLLSLA